MDSSSVASLRAVLGVISGLFVAGACLPDYRFQAELPPDYCGNGVRDSGESGTDCGGRCGPCPVSSACFARADCVEGDCVAGFCQDATCNNGQKDTTEVGLDCGGARCKPCSTGAPCVEARDCASAVCEASICVSAQCDDGVRNGEETGIDCGGSECPGCGNDAPCRTGADCATARCEASRCVGSCPAGKAECDGNSAELCETDVLSNAGDCGRCGSACEPENATGVCTAGSCRISSCTAPFENCNRLTDDGCEADLSADAQHCGGCNQACPAINGTAVCVDSLCATECADGFGDCDGIRSNGCEADTSDDPQNCGQCERQCPAAASETPFCADGKCGATVCPTGSGNCVDALDGVCETQFGTDPQHCTRCGDRCVVAHGTPACTATGCRVADCDEGFGNCNAADPNGYADGCETDLSTSVDNCGGCGSEGRACSAAFANATGRCEAATCVIDRCDSGFGDCSAGPGCETNVLTDEGHCGLCGRACLVRNATSNLCTAGTCTPVCNPGWGACTNPAAGCTDRLDSAQFCGDCNRACTGTTPFCVAGGCRAQLDVTLVNSALNFAVQGPVMLDHSLQGAKGQYRLVLLALAAYNPQDAAAAQPTLVTYAGNAMLQHGGMPYTRGRVSTSFYYLADGALPEVPGAYPLRITTPNGMTEYAGNVLEFRGVQQSNPLDASALMGDDSVTSPRDLTASLTTLTPNSFLYALGAFEWGEGDAVVGSLTSAFAARRNSGVALRGLGGYRARVPVSTYTVGWRTSGVYSARYAVAVRPATTP